MPLVTALKREPLIASHLKATCAEHAMGATISPDIALDDIVIISPDGYYNSLRQNRPKSPDCLIVVRCHDGKFMVFLVELRDIGSPKGFEPAAIRAKFLTCLTDFMQGVLGAHFNRPDIELQRPRLIFVSDPYGQRQDPERISRYNRTTRIDALLTVPPIRFDGRLLAIEPRVENPLIRPC